MEILKQVHRMVWGPWLMLLFLAAGIFWTLRSGAFQLRGVGVWWRATAGSLLLRQSGGADKKTQIKTACTALAATVGTGNIVGVAAAITAGGPGALFWMWVSAGLGMMTAYAEVYLGILSRYRKDGSGEFVCGPYVYLDRLAGNPGLAGVYALLCLLASLSMGSMVQANSLTETVNYSFSFPKAGTAAALGILTALVIRGGRKRIGETAVPASPPSPRSVSFRPG